MTDAQSILILGKEHISSLLNGSENKTLRDGEPDIPFDDDGKVVPLLAEEVRIASAFLKNNKAAGVGGEELIRCMYQLLCKILSEKSMAND